MRFLASILFVMTLLLDPAGSQVLEPPLQDLAVGKGQRKRIELRVANSQEIPLRCTLVAHNVSVDLYGRVTPDSSAQRGCAEWLTIEETDFVLPPQEGRTIRAELKMPREVAGGYYAMFRAVFRATEGSMGTLDLGSTEGERRQLFPTMGASSLLLLDVRSRENTSDVVTDSLVISSGRVGRDLIDEQDRADGVWAVDLIMRNGGNVHTRVRGGLSIWRANGQFVGRSEFSVGRGYVLPGTRRALRARGDRPLEDGIYIGRFDVAVERQGRLQQVTTFHVVDGVASPGEPDSTTTRLLNALLPKFAIRRTFKETRIRPGRETSLIVSLKNTQNDTLRLRPLPSTWHVDSLGTNRLLLADELADPGPAGWLVEAPDEVVLEPGRTQNCRISIVPPESLMAGEYYFGVYFEDDEGVRTPPEARFNRSQLNCLRFGYDLPHEARLDTFVVRREGSRVRVDSEITNDGKRRIAPTVSVQLSRLDVTGQWQDFRQREVFDSGDTAFILPGGTRRYAHTAYELPPGSYRAELKVEFVEETVKDWVRRILFEIPESVTTASE